MEHGLLSRAVEYVSRQRQKKRWQKVVTAMAAVVVFCTTYALILPAITLEHEVYCGQEEHIHDEACYGQVLTCGLPEAEVHVHTDGCYQTDSTLVCTQAESAGHTHGPECQQTETHLTCTSTEEGHAHGAECYTTTTTTICGLAESPGHTHGADCWQHTKTLICTESTEVPEGGHVHGEACYGPSQEPICGLAEHEHQDDCYSDANADRETAAQWEKTFEDVELTGEFPADVLAIAETQLGYTESKTNFIKNDEGRKLGYSRYGAWYGDPYGDWCAMFVSFCLYYAEIPAEDFPREASCQRWIEDLTDMELYREAEDYIPNPGDLIFFNWDEEPDSDHVGLVEEIVLDHEGNYKEIKTIEGNSSNKVQHVTYDWGDESIMGYGDLGEAYRLWLEKHPPEEVPEEEDIPDEPLALSYEGEDLTLTATLEPGAELPADVELVVEDIQPGSLEADYVSHYKQAQEALGLAEGPEDEGLEETEEGEEPQEEVPLTDFRLYDISLQVQGEPIVPETPVTLTLTVPAPEEPEDEEEPVPEVSLLHFDENGEAPEVQPLTEEEPGELTATFALRANTLDAVVLAAPRSADNRITVLFDGQMGAHKYYDSNNRTGYIKYAGMERRLVYAEDGKVTLPTSLNAASGYYNYKIVGWYDIVNNVYYGENMLGQEIEVDGDTVFYPDYVAASYDFGSASNLAPNLANTSSFIDIDVFDYNEMFNLQSATYVGDPINLVEGNTATYHTGNWKLNPQGILGGFVFSDWIQDPSGTTNNPDNEGITDNTGDGNIGRVFNLGVTNANNSVSRESGDIGNDSKTIPFYGNITSGLLTDARKTALFDPSTARPPGRLDNANQHVLGREYLGKGDHLFCYDDTTGYYYYNSALNAASYNKSQQRFYVYDSPAKVDNEYSVHDFLPFNSGSAIYEERNTKVNFWFGMKTEIDFYLPADVGGAESHLNVSSHDLPMEFRFAGDDDVWVFVDDQLVLDMGGVHDIVYGGINFATNTVTLGQGKAANTAVGRTDKMPGVTAGQTGVTTSSLTEKFGSKRLSAGHHTLTIYYMERGSSLSNCAIYFNIAPAYELELLKKDAQTGEALSGAKFAVYDDEACTDPATLYPMVNGQVSAQSGHEFTTDASGDILLWGLNPGGTYYIKETAPPEGYPRMADIVIRMDLSAAGEPTLLLLNSTGESWVYADAHRVQEVVENGEIRHRVYLNIFNQKDIRGTKEVYVEKVWEGGGTHDDQITVRLYANGQDTGRSMTLTAQDNWKGVFYELPEKDANGGDIQYTVQEYPVPSGYRVRYEVSSGSLTEPGPAQTWERVNTLVGGGTYLLIQNVDGQEKALGSIAADQEGMQWVNGAYNIRTGDPAQAPAHVVWYAESNTNGFRLKTGQGTYLRLWHSERTGESGGANFFVKNTTPNGSSNNFKDWVSVDSQGRLYTVGNSMNGGGYFTYYFTTLNHDGGIKSAAATSTQGVSGFAIYRLTDKAADPVEEIGGWKVTNYPVPDDAYMLPETGGPGVHWYILGGILLLAGGTLWYRKQENGKEGETS